MVLNCEVNTDGAKAKWLQNGETLFESSKCVMVQRDNVFSLRIRDVHKGDEASFSISLTNQRGEQAKSSCSLTVKGQQAAASRLGLYVCLEMFLYQHDIYFLLLFRGESEDHRSS